METQKELSYEEIMVLVRSGEWERMQNVEKEIDWSGSEAEKRANPESSYDRACRRYRECEDRKRYEEYCKNPESWDF